MAFVSLKLFVDKKKDRVVFAESEKDFVDILFSFLTLPMGTIIRLLGKKSSLVCMDKLYESVENLNTKYLETKACKTMLLQPRSAAERLCEDLIVNANDLIPRRFYVCPTFDCLTKANRLYSTICGALCPCGQEMGEILAIDGELDITQAANDAKDGVFLKGVTTYIISDDLHVVPATVTTTLSLLQKMGIDDANTLEMQTVDVHRDEVLSLLKRLLLSKTPLTDIFLQKQYSVSSHEEGDRLIETARIKLSSEIEDKDQGKAIIVKLLHNKITNEVVSAEAGNDFVDVILSFLTFPLGSIVKLLNKHSFVNCIDNLYHSVEALAADSNFIKSENCKNMLLSPKLYSHFNCSNQLIEIETNLPTGCSVQGCATCRKNCISALGHTKCSHGINVVRFTEINPKLKNSGTENGGGFAKSVVRYIVSSEMNITALSSTSAIDVIKQLKAPISSLVEEEVTLGEAEVLNLLKACLTSSNALNSILFPKKSRKLSKHSTKIKSDP